MARAAEWARALGAAILASGCMAGPLPAGSFAGPGDLAATADAGSILNGGTCARTPAVEIAARQTVTIAVKNSLGADAWLVTRGDSCAPFGIGVFDGLNDNVVYFQTLAAYQCNCIECHRPPDMRASSYRRVKMGETYVLTWPATSVVACTEEMACPMGAPVKRWVAANQPVGAGLYRITVGYQTSAPGGPCTQSGEDWTCPSSMNGSGPAPPFFEGLCDAPSIAQVQFTLPDSGDVMATVELK